MWNKKPNYVLAEKKMHFNETKNCIKSKYCKKNKKVMKTLSIEKPEMPWIEWNSIKKEKKSTFWYHVHELLEEVP